jgi:ABC-type sugar transport system ATPase subunit
MADAEALATLRSVAKRYGGIQAVAGVDLDIYSGRIHAICGENGAGKSTLMRIVAGVERPDSGSVQFGGRPIDEARGHWNERNAIAVVFQELSLFPDLDILANLFLRKEPLRLGLVDRRRMRALAAPIVAELGLAVDLDAPVRTLRLAEQQLVEIARALLTNARLLILDEPNSALTARESERLFAILRRLKLGGIAILFISHRLEEVFALCDWITVLRNGAKVRDISITHTSIGEIVVYMVGPIRRSPPRNRSTSVNNGAALAFQQVSVDNQLFDVSFEARPGEVVGLAGLEGSGVTAPFDLLFGKSRQRQGEIRLPSGGRTPLSPHAAVAAGIALVPADRRTEGLSLDQDIVANMMAVAAGVLGRHGEWLRQADLDRRTTARANALHLVRDSLRQPARNLSGGNQQKVAIGKWLESDPQILLLDDPTRGVDIGAKSEIYRIIAQQAEAGRIVLFHSTELQEFAEVCHRVLVFYRGRVIGELAGTEISEHALLHAANVGEIVAGGPAARIGGAP